MLTIFCVMAGLTAMAQNITVTGTVTDSDTKEPLIGASVVAKNGKNGTATDIDGKFTINAPKGTELTVSYVGYTSKTVKINSAEMTIALSPDNNLLEEVVVVGYGVQKKSSLTGSVSTMKAADMENRSITSINEALQGKVSGVSSYVNSGSPTGSTSIQIRGIGSNGSSAPLFVVDGRVATSADEIDPSDIESVEILKDGSSTAIYGASAGNGVILITTKKGKGEGKISFSMQLSSQSLGKHPRVLNSEQFIDYYTENGALTMDKVYQYWDMKQNTDWVDVTFENSLMQHYNLKFSGSSEKGNYYISGSYLHNNGIIVGDRDKYQRITGMFNGSYYVKKWLEINTNNNVAYGRAKSVTEGSMGLIMPSLQLDPLTAPTYSADNLPPNLAFALANPEKYGNLLTDGNGNYYGMSPFVATNQVNPLILRDREDNESRSFMFTGTTGLNIKPFKGFTFTSRLSYTFTNTESRAYTLPYFASYDSGALQNFISLDENAGNSYYWQWENFANYHHEFKGGHELTAMLGMSFSENRSNSLKGSMSGTPGENNDGGNLGFQRPDPDFVYFDFATATAVKGVGGGLPSYIRKLAYFGRVNYNYQNRYLAQFSLRADAADTSILPKNERWGYFPAASAGWVVSNENFMEETHSWLNNLKLRGSWGRNGSIASLVSRLS